VVKRDARPLRIVTRGSALALWQAHHVRDALARAGHPPPELVIVRTTGDRIQDVPLSRIGDRGLFTREVDEALYDDRADIAVHSAKDVPTSVAEGLELVAYAEREDPSDVLVARDGRTLDQLPAGARVGTSSLRRRAQLAALRPDLEIVDLRGNVDTRIERVHQGAVDAAILARAGLLRLDRATEATDILAAPGWLPAVGQGALALVMRAGDASAADVAAALDHAPTRTAVLAERALLRRLEGGCQVPIGALATVSGDALQLDAAVFSLDGATALRASLSTPASRAEQAGEELAARLIADGAEDLLAAIRATSASAPAVPEP
jgi:hydroxymethylbilane synthase